jgi:hypothetical protein
MHIHSIQFNLDMQMYALQAAAKAEAKLEAARTRKKLINFASVLAGEFDDETDFVVRLNGDGAPRDQSNRQDTQGEFTGEKQDTQANSDSDLFSNWA